MMQELMIEPCDEPFGFCVDDFDFSDIDFLGEGNPAVTPHTVHITFSN